LKICHVVCGLENGGIETVLYNYLSRMDFSGDELHLITYNEDAPECVARFQALGFRIHRIPPKRDGFLTSNRSMRAVIRSGRFDVVHAHLSEWNCIPLYYAWRSGVKKRIHHAHTLKAQNGFLKKRAFGALNALAIRLATDRVACSETVAAAWFGRRRLRRGCVQILKNGIDVARFLPDADVRREVRAGWNAADGLCVGFVGRLMDEKNPLFLLDVFAELQKTRADAKLVFCGDGPLNAALRKKARALRLEESVLLLGIRQDMERMYQGFDVLAMPSLYEGFPLAAVEAQAAGLPCCFSDTVSGEVGKTPACSFLPLKAGPAVWAVEMISLAGKRSMNGDGAKMVTEAGLSIYDQVAALEKLYGKTRGA
jgi:glycosyltransferase involved in cell wall biosynthesis